MYYMSDERCNACIEYIISLQTCIIQRRSHVMKNRGVELRTTGLCKAKIGALFFYDTV